MATNGFSLFILRGIAGFILCFLAPSLSPLYSQWVVKPEKVFQPERIRAFLVGILEFSDPESYEGFTSKNRRDALLASMFLKAGVPKDRITFLKDKAATLKTIREALKQTLALSRPGETFFFYYAGHGDSNDEGASFFNPFDCKDPLEENLSASEIISTIEKEFKGDRVILAADCCRAGGLVDGIRGKKGRISWSAFSASAAHEWSTGNWTFTSAILAAFRGRPYVDLNRNGRIEFGEIAEHVARDMQVLEEQMSDADWSGNEISSDTVLTDVVGSYPTGRIGHPIEAKLKKVWLRGKIVSEKPRQVRVHWADISKDRDREERWISSSDVREIRFKTFPVNAKVLVDWRDEWYPAIILQQKGGIHFVHYNGYNSSWDEWVPSNRIKKAK